MHAPPQQLRKSHLHTLVSLTDKVTSYLGEVKRCPGFIAVCVFVHGLLTALHLLCHGADLTDWKRAFSAIILIAS